MNHYDKANPAPSNVLHVVDDLDFRQMDNLSLDLLHLLGYNGNCHLMQETMYPLPLPVGGNSGCSNGVGIGGVSGETGSAQTGSCLGGMGTGGGGGGLGAVLWDDDYRALRARLEVPSLGFGSLRTPGQGMGSSPVASSV